MGPVREPFEERALARRRRAASEGPRDDDQRRQVAQILALQRSAGNQTVARMLSRGVSSPRLQRKGAHALDDALGLKSGEAREQLGPVPFNTAAGWPMGGLEAIFRSTTPVVNLRTLATNFNGQAGDVVTRLIGVLTPLLGVPPFVQLTPPQALYLERHLANIAIAQAMLAVATDATHAEALMQYLTPYLAHPAQLAVARQELEAAGNDVAVAGPRAAFLTRHAADPIALRTAREELESAAGDTVAAAREVEILSRYHYDRALRDAAAAKGKEVADAELVEARDEAARKKQLAFAAAERAEAEYIRTKSPELPKKPKKSNPTYQGKLKKAQTQIKQVKDDAAEARTQAETAATEAETSAVEAATVQSGVTKARVISGVEGFIDTATQAHGPQDAEFLIKTAKFDVTVASALRPLFTARDGRSDQARSVAAWAMGTYGADQAKLARAVHLLNIADGAHLSATDAPVVVATAMKLKIGDAGFASLCAAAGPHLGAWDAVGPFLTTHYAAGADDAHEALTLAHTHTVKLDELEPFGKHAHVFMRHLAGKPVFFKQVRELVLEAWPEPHADLNELCLALNAMSGLARDKIELLVETEAAQLKRLRTSAPAFAHVVTAAGALSAAQLATALPWYVAWLIDMGQPVAGTAAIVAAFPDVKERTALIVPLAHPSLGARLLGYKGAMAGATFAKIVKILDLAAGLKVTMGAMETMFAAIDASFAASANSLYDQLISGKIGSVRPAIVDAHDRGVRAAYVAWVVAKAANLGPADTFLGHENALHEYLASAGADLVQTRTVRCTRQKLTGTSGGSTDVLHIFAVTFTLKAGGNVVAELHNHVHAGTKSETSMHFKNVNARGPEFSNARLSADCETAVRGYSGNTRFPTGYKY